MENPWDDIDALKPETENPINIVKKIFTPVYEKTNKKVIYKLQEVYFFPEEVRTRSLIFEELDPYKEVSHPDFGYEPYHAKEKQYFRYRLLLSPVVNENIEYELFKFKFSLFFYPIQFFFDKDNFSGLESFIDSEKKLVTADNEKELHAIISTIIQSKSTIKLIKRLMVL